MRPTRSKFLSKDDNGNCHRYSTTTHLSATPTSGQKHYFFKTFAAVNLSGVFVVTVLKMAYGEEERGAKTEL